MKAYIPYFESNSRSSPDYSGLNWSDPGTFLPLSRLVPGLPNEQYIRHYKGLYTVLGGKSTGIHPSPPSYQAKDQAIPTFRPGFRVSLEGTQSNAGHFPGLQPIPSANCAYFPVETYITLPKALNTVLVEGYRVLTVQILCIRCY